MLFDTDVLIDYLRGVEKAVTCLENHPGQLLISAIVVAELFAGVREGAERDKLNAFIRAFEILPVDGSVAELGGLFRRDYRKSHNTGLADALIAATAKRHNTSLVTSNTKHYPMLSNIVVPYQKS
jgi:predicted nucleic acid-binding protein